MKFRTVGTLLAAGVLALGAACTTAEQGDGEAYAMAMPDTTAEALWAHTAGYAEDWHVWPGKGELYMGTEPHGMLLTTYLNDLALDALTNKAGAMPVGAVVVKENYMPDSTLAAITIMYKSEGYNPDVNDWFFVKRMADGTVAASGRVGGCTGCHSQVAANDYLFTGSLSQ